MPSSDQPIPPIRTPSFTSVVQAASPSSSHWLGITLQGTVFSGGPSNSHGQLGRSTAGRKQARTPTPVTFNNNNNTDESSVKAHRVFAGGASDSGHSAVLDRSGQLWLTGCDRWQQLGLGSPSGGAGGYTWVGGKIHQTVFQRNNFIVKLVKEHADEEASIRDVALGGDHTIVLSSNQKDVFTFGKGAEGQLGLNEKRFLSAATKSPTLSSSTGSPKIAAVCAFQNCSMTLDVHGKVLEQVGKCRSTKEFVNALAGCRKRAEQSDLLREGDADRQ
jgi:alpha-tubulin suppressor-like RCC1 family protein